MTGDALNFVFAISALVAGFDRESVRLREMEAEAARRAER